VPWCGQKEGGFSPAKTSSIPSSCSGKCEAEDLISGTQTLQTDVLINKLMFVLASLCHAWSRIHHVSPALQFIINLLIKRMERNNSSGRSRNFNLAAKGLAAPAGNSWSYEHEVILT